MRIAHLTTVHGPGDIRIFHKQCRSLSEAGHDILLVVPHTQDETIDGVRLRALKEPGSRMDRAIRTARQLIGILLEERPDVCHFHDPELVPTGLLLKAAGFNVVYDVHEDSAEKLRERGWLPGVLRPILPPLFRGLERVAAHLFDANVCATPDLASRFPGRNTITVRNFPRAELIEQSRPVESYRPENRILIYTGGWTPHRGVEQIVAALEFVETPQVRLVVIGKRHDEVYQRARRMPGFPLVDYRGEVPHDHAVKLLQRSAVGLVCNQPRHGYDRALPNKLFEYMATGLPVVASHFDRWREIVEETGAGLTVDPEDPRDIAVAVDHLLRDSDLRRRMGEHGRTAVESCYNWQREESKLIGLYEGLGR